METERRFLCSIRYAITFQQQQKKIVKLANCYNVFIILCVIILENILESIHKISSDKFKFFLGLRITKMFLNVLSYSKPRGLNQENFFLINIFTLLKCLITFKWTFTYFSPKQSLLLYVHWMIRSAAWCPYRDRLSLVTPRLSHVSLRSMALDEASSCSERKHNFLEAFFLEGCFKSEASSKYCSAYVCWRLYSKN